MGDQGRAKQLHIPLSELFKSQRKELGIELKEVEKKTGIRSTYLEKIEAGRYDQLPDTVYIKGYVKNYADFLGFDTQEIMRMYSRERAAYASNSPAKKQASWRSLKPLEGHRFVLTPRLLVVLVGLLVVVGIFGYIGWQFLQLAVPPKIIITSPNNDTVTTPTLILSGQTEAGSELFINGSPVLIGVDGSFSEQISLVDGVNTVTVRARNKLGKTSEVVKNYTAKFTAAAAPNPADQLSNTTLDGVQLLVTVSKQATWVSISADGQDTFRGTMLPGSGKFFSAKQVIKLTTGNGGATSATISNSKVARKELGQVGKDGEAKLDMVFNKDTEFGL